MKTSSIGVHVDDFGLSVKEGLRKAADLAFGQFEISAVSGDLAPTNLSQSGRRHFLRLAHGLGLNLTALVGDMPGMRLTDLHTVDERVSRSCQLLELATDLNVGIVAARIGQLTHPESGEPSETALQALSQIGEVAESRGLVYALRPVGVEPERLEEILDKLGCPGLAITVDPAAMVMRGQNPMTLLERLGQHVSLVHMRDGTAGTLDQQGVETVLGQGDVDLDGLLAVIDVLDYRGAYILRRSDSATPTEDVLAGRDMLAKMLP